jgi:DNA (cytosine-5)-methyltransferase 1
MTAYYNEIDPNAAEWTRELIKAGLIADGEVDERSIIDVEPNDLRGFTQCHFFSGIAVWSYALRQAGWADDREVWTGSCPCQPFSCAGKGAGTADKRHLWPEFHRLIKELRPASIFGEQVGQKAGAGWFDSVQSDMEGEDYACGMVVFPACGIGAPHQRQRLYWLAELGNSTSNGCHRGRQGGKAEKGRKQRSEQKGQLSDGFEGRGVVDRLANNESGRRGKEQQDTGRVRTGTEKEENETGGFGTGCTSFGVANTSQQGLERFSWHGNGINKPRRQQEKQAGSVTKSGAHNNPRPINGFWRDADWLGCRDGKWRPVEPGSFPLVNVSSTGVGSRSNPSIQDVESTKEARVIRLKGYGNAIVAEQAKMIIEAYL